MVNMEPKGYMVMLVLDNPNLTPQVLDAWHKAGVPGATVHKSAGLHSTRRAMRRIFPASTDYPVETAYEEDPHSTLFAVVPTLDLVEELFKVTQDIVGDFRKPRTGIMAAWPVYWVQGLDKEPFHNPHPPQPQADDADANEPA